MNDLYFLYSYCHFFTGVNYGQSLRIPLTLAVAQFDHFEAQDLWL